MDLSFLYWIDVLSNLQNILFILGAISLLATIVCGVCFAIEYSYDENISMQTTKSLLKWSRIFFGVFLFCLIVCLFIPSKETLYTIAIGKYVTVENLEVGAETLTSSIDYIFSKIESLIN